MRYIVGLFAAALLATPAAAQQQGSAAVPPDMTKRLADPATADMLSNMMKAMSGAFLNLPIGEMEAAAEGRKPTDADRKRTVREAGRAEDPNFDRNFQQQMANSKPMIEQGLKTLATTLPAVMKALEPMGRQLEEAVENMPRPNYPRQ